MILTPVATEIAHIRHQGMGGDSEGSLLNQPDNLILACRACHEKLHGRGAYRITRWAPGAPDGLEVVSHRGKPVPRDDLWYYVQQRISDVRKLITRALMAAQENRAISWQIAHILAQLADVNAIIPTATTGSCQDYLDLAADLGYTTANAKRLIRCARFARDHDEFERLPIEVVDIARRHPERADEILELADKLPPAEFWRWVEQELRRARRLRGWSGEGTLREVELDPAGQWEASLAPGTWVLKGGSLVYGARKEET